MSQPVILGTGPDFLDREGLTTSIATWEDGQRIGTAPGLFEWWYFDAHFDDGSTAVIVFSTKPLVSPGDPLRPNVALTITRPNGGRKVSQLPIYPAEQFSASAQTCDVRIGPSWIKQQNPEGACWTYAVHAEATGLAADLTFTGLVPPWRPGAGKSYFGNTDHYFAWLPSIPYGTVEGTLTYAGQTQRVKGTGYHDHNWGNINLSKVLDHWYWGRAHLGEYTLIFVEQIAAKAYGFARIPVFLLAKGDQVIADDAQFLTMQARDLTQHPQGRQYPREVDFVWQKDGDSVHLSLRQPHIIEATSLLITLPPWQRSIARLLVNPYYFRFNTELEFRVDVGQLHGVERGPALYEIMLLK